jgi:hypothetical protein
MTNLETNPMHPMANAVTFLFAALAAAAIVPAPAAAAEPTYCPSPAHAGPGKVPAGLTPMVAMAFQIDAATVRDAAFVRCVGGKLMACYVGANLDCFKADTRRRLPGATAWCRENPGSAGIPAAATGHDTIYDWSCQGRRAVPGKVLMTVDPQGYIAENWKEIVTP